MCWSQVSHKLSSNVDSNVGGPCEQRWTTNTTVIKYFDGHGRAELGLTSDTDLTVSIQPAYEGKSVSMPWPSADRVGCEAMAANSLLFMCPMNRRGTLDILD